MAHMRYNCDFLGDSVVKTKQMNKQNHLPVQEMWVQSFCQEDPPKKEIATHFILLTQKIPSTEEAGGL